MMRVGLSHDPLRFYLSFYDVSLQEESFFGVFLLGNVFGVCILHSGLDFVLAIFSHFFWVLQILPPFYSVFEWAKTAFFYVFAKISTRSFDFIFRRARTAS